MPDPHPSTQAVGYLTLSEARAAIDAGSLSARSWVESLRARTTAIESDPATTLNAIAWLDDDVVERTRRPGPLSGVPVLIKDSIEALGSPATAGAGALRGRPARDAELVTRVKRAGALVIGSTNLSQWANLRSSHSTSGWSSLGGLVANPWALDRSAGGSSSGCGAALAGGYAPLAIGTETDGSIVCPASLNGIVGIKPTVGSVPRAGVVPISASQDSPGPMGRCVKDVAALLEILCETHVELVADPLDVTVAPWPSGEEGTDALFAEVVAALGKEGHRVTTRDVVAADESVWNDELTVLLCEMADDLDAYLAERPGEGVRSLAEAIDFEKRHAAVELAHFGHDLFERSLALGGRSNPEYAPARQRNLEWAIERCLEPALERADVLIAACYVPAWKSDLVLGDPGGQMTSGISSPAGIAGWPIASVPMGLVDGLPVGLAIVGRPGAESTVLSMAACVERLVDLDAVLRRPRWAGPSRG